MKIEEKKRTLRLSSQLLHFMTYGDWNDVGTYHVSQLTDEQSIFMLDQLYNEDERFRTWVNGKIEEGHILVKRKRSDPTMSADNNESRFTPEKDFEIIHQVQIANPPEVKKLMAVLKAINDPSVPKTIVAAPERRPISAVVNEVLDEFKEAGITQRQVANRMGLVESRISSWKHDHSPIPTDRLHQLLNLRDRLCR